MPFSKDSSSQVLFLSSQTQDKDGQRGIGVSLDVRTPVESKASTYLPAKHSLSDLAFNAIKYAAEARQAQILSTVNTRYLSGAHEAQLLEEWEGTWKGDLNGVRDTLCSVDGTSKTQGDTIVPALYAPGMGHRMSSHSKSLRQEIFPVFDRTFVNDTSLSVLAKSIDGVEHDLKQSLGDGRCTDVADYLSRTSEFDLDIKSAYLAKHTIRDAQSKTKNPRHFWTYQVDSTKEEPVITLSLKTHPRCQFRDKSVPPTYGRLNRLMDLAKHGIVFAQMGRKLKRRSRDPRNLVDLSTVERDGLENDVVNVLSVLSSHDGDPLIFGETLYVPPMNDKSHDNVNVPDPFRLPNDVDNESFRFNLSPWHFVANETFSELDKDAERFAEGVTDKITKSDAQDVIDYLMHNTVQMGYQRGLGNFLANETLRFLRE